MVSTSHALCNVKWYKEWCHIKQASKQKDKFYCWFTWWGGVCLNKFIGALYIFLNPKSSYKTISFELLAWWNGNSLVCLEFINWQFITLTHHCYLCYVCIYFNTSMFLYSMNTVVQFVMHVFGIMHVLPNQNNYSHITHPYWLVQFLIPYHL